MVVNKTNLVKLKCRFLGGGLGTKGEDFDSVSKDEDFDSTIKPKENL